MSNESTITSKGQITIPAEFRKDYNLQPGKKVVFVPIKEGILIKPMKHQFPSLRGIIKSDVEVSSLNKAVKDLRKEWRLENDQ